MNLGSLLTRHLLSCTNKLKSHLIFFPPPRAGRASAILRMQLANKMLGFIVIVFIIFSTFSSFLVPFFSPRIDIVHVLQGMQFWRGKIKCCFALIKEANAVSEQGAGVKNRGFFIKSLEKIVNSFSLHV